MNLIISCQVGFNIYKWQYIGRILKLLAKDD